jgi:serine/threonine protein kinase
MKPGQIVQEYAIEQTLGGGGFGVTYLARDVNLGLPVALKEYFPADMAFRHADGSVQPLGDSTEEAFKQGLERFIEEARSLAAFRHPNIVRVLRYFNANGTAYIVMEYESGHPLNQWYKLHSPVNRATLLNLTLPLLDGLELIHKAGFLHRDIKPDNIYVRRDGTPALIDFGSARNTTAGRDLTTIVSPGFAPFEQYHAQGNQGPWTDLYSLAAVMYWLVSGNKPVESASRLKKDSMVPAMQCGNPAMVGTDILHAIDWALNPEETQRPQSVAPFRQALMGESVTGPLTEKFAPTQPPLGSHPATQFASRETTEFRPPQGNMVCSVLFLDIVAYSKESVKQQYEIKSRFNQLILGKIAHIPSHMRITLDTGDGAGICFMGDPEEVLGAAISIRQSLDLLQPMKVRMGLHLGPVRVLNDMNGHVNVVGDGINAAQRVMSFAGENGLLLSKAFHDVVAWLSDGSEHAFRHLGAQADKHGRSHDLYEPALPDGNQSDVPTLRLGEQSAPAVAEIDPSELAEIERDLSNQLGPLAPVLIRKARRKATSAKALREILAQSIANVAQRESFLSAHTTDRSGDSAAKRDSRAAGNSDSRAPTSNRVSLGNSGTTSTAFAQHAWLTPELIAQLEQHLAQTVGPIARTLIKREGKKAADFDTLCQALASHIDDAKDRLAFLKVTGKLRGS